MKFPGDSDKKSRKATAKDVPGSGQARKAGDAIEKRKSRNRSALEMARRATNPGGRKKKDNDGY